jgi:cobalamin biosynthesis protein CobT
MTKTKLVVEDQHLVALSCTLIIYRGLDACSINTVILGITLLFLE